MSVPEIVQVEPDSLAAELGLESGDRVLRINGRRVKDLIQFQFEWADEEVLLEIEKSSGQREVIQIEKDYDEPLGAVFDSPIYNALKICRNKCVFCFVDQMPPRMRKSLYIKDDDYRLSFLQGSFVSLTNLKKEDLERIKKEHLSPLYVSVHVTDPRRREEMLQNREAGKILDILTGLSREGIAFHTQVVLCPGLNDGSYLEQTYNDLYGIEGVKSLAVVPVGMTRHRVGLPTLEGFDGEKALGVIQWAAKKQEAAFRERGSSFVWLADEFYMMAGCPLPSYEHYEDFPQLENGVGMTRLFWQEFEDAQLPGEVTPPREVTIVTGISGEIVLKPLVESLNTIKGLKINLRPVPNVFFGPSVTVTGLLTGTCLLAGLEGIAPGSVVLIPAVLLKMYEGRFLDDLTVRELEERLSIRIIRVPVDGSRFLASIIAG